MRVAATVPSQGAVPEDAFFEDHHEGREPLSVCLVVSKIVVPKMPPDVKPIPKAKAPKAAAVKAAIEKWEAEGDQDGCRNQGIFALGRDLSNAGYDNQAVKAMLFSAIDKSRSREKAKMKADVPRMMRRIRHGTTALV